MAAVVEEQAQSWATQIDHEAQSWASASLIEQAMRDANQAWAVTMVSVELAHRAVSWAIHWGHQPLEALAATAVAAVYSR
jgi:hypothetical protein